MILGFKTTHNGRFTLFAQKVLANVSPTYKADFIPKTHTIRKGRRWKAGDKIHMATGVRTPKYTQFNKGLAGLDTVISVQEIQIKNMFNDRDGIFVDGRKLDDKEIILLAMNDGFNSVDELWDWFPMQDFEGQIIHWTSLKY